ncbi:MAG: LamG-like jellyroll fold domain-containing protein [Planctomycetota bacterium]
MTPEIEQLVHDVLHGDAGDEDRQRLSEWVVADEANAKAYLRVTMDERAMRVNLERAEARSVEQLSDSPDDTNAGAVLAELAELEERSAALDPMALAAEQFPASTARPIRNKQYASALSYVFDHVVTPKRLSILAAAAVLLLSVVLSIVFLTEGDKTPETAAVPDFTQTTPTLDPNRVVATVTGQVNAQWVSANGQGALPDRMLLAVNQRLTLTEGFAEITTNRGAKVLLQAPATIETTDSDNAVRLHRGKLVGRCETPSSKGFVVHAPGMDVIDLGTVFGVSADADNGSTVTVMEGSVRAEPAETSPLAFEPVVLGRDEARRVKPETGGLEAVALSESPVFHASPVHPYLAAVLDAKPVAYWRFEEEASQSIENEIDPSRSALVAKGSVRLDAAGLLGRAARFDNTVQADGYFLTTEPFDAIGRDDPFTIEMWVWVGQELDQDTGSGSLGGLYDTRSESLDHVVHVEIQPQDAPEEWGPGSIRVHYEDLVIDQDGESEVHGLFSEKPYAVGRWQHVVINRDSGKLTLYLDGQFTGTLAEQVDVVERPALVLGRSMRLTRYLRNSKIDEVAFYDRALTEDEIKSHWLAMQPLDAAQPNP